LRKLGWVEDDGIKRPALGTKAAQLGKDIAGDVFQT